MEEMTVTAAATQRPAGSGIDLAYDTRVKAIKVGGEQVEDVRFIMRATNIDVEAWEKLSERYGDADRPGISKEQQTELATGMFKVVGKNMATRGSALEIDELSAGFHGHRAVIKGRFTLAKGTDADFKSMDTLGKKVVARLDVRVPVALINEVAKVAMARDAESKGQKMAPNDLEQTAQSFADIMVGKMLNGGYAKLDNGVLVSLIEVKNGKLKLNGKEIAFPKAKPQTKEQAAISRAAAAAADTD
jgi:uncharacterized protein YdgA (DUF945 family)